MDRLEGAPVLVTGATGFIGSHLVEKLVGLGCRVRCLVRRTSSLAALPVSRIELAYGDLGSGAGLAEAVRGASFVFHLGGLTKALSNSEFYRGNARGTENLLRAIEGAAAPPTLVHVSTLAAVGPSSDGTPIREDVPPNPVTHYGRSKLEAEQAVRRSPVSGSAVIVRPPVVYGPRDTDVYRVFRLIARGFLLRLGRDEGFFSLIHAGDLAEGLVAAARCEQARGRTYFLANDKPASWTEFAETAARIMGRPLRVVSVPWPAAYAAGYISELSCRLRKRPGIISREKLAEARCRYWVCDTSRAREDIGFTARKSLAEGIADTLDWYRQAGWLHY